MATAVRAFVVVFAGCLSLAGDEPGDASDIMKRAAAHTSAATEARRRYVYQQKVRASLMRTDGKVARKETREYAVTPQKASTDKTLVSFSGEYRAGGGVTPYSRPGVKDKGDDRDRENLQHLVDELVNAGNTRDGIPHDLFPLSVEDLRYYNFALKGETSVRGRRTFDIVFEPAELRSACIHVGTVIHIDISTRSPDPAGTEELSCRQWKGEAWIDAEDYQPVRIETQMAKGVPWGVRAFLGINVQQFGFSVEYRRVADNVWFPVTYGTEFGFEVLWGYRRTMTLSMENSDFRKTDADSAIYFEVPEAEFGHFEFEATA